eukprot:1015456-Prymnesium_polylepis.1
MMVPTTKSIVAERPAPMTCMGVVLSSASSTILHHASSTPASLKSGSPLRPRASIRMGFQKEAHT